MKASLSLKAFHLANFESEIISLCLALNKCTGPRIPSMSLMWPAEPKSCPTLLRRRSWFPEKVDDDFGKLNLLSMDLNMLDFIISQSCSPLVKKVACYSKEKKCFFEWQKNWLHFKLLMTSSAPKPFDMLPRPISACVFCLVVRFLRTYIG